MFFLRNIPVDRNEKTAIIPFWGQNEKEKRVPESQKLLFNWQGRHDLNAQPAVLETAALPLSHSPKFATNILFVGLHSVKRNVKIVSSYILFI